jgi:hypothetical protein
MVCVLICFLSTAVYACPFTDADYTIAVKKAVLDYLSSPGSGLLDKEDVKTMVLFYLTNPTISASTDCSQNDVDMLSQLVDDKVPDDILAKLGTRKLAVCDKCGTTPCGSIDSAGQRCACISLDSDATNYEACHLSPMVIGPSACSSCRDGTACGKTNSVGKKCSCPSPYSCFLSNAAACSDSDGGIVYSVKGTVIGWFLGLSYSYSDQCMSATQLKEYFCNTTSRFDSVLMNCASAETCSNGACIALTTTTSQPVTGICSTCQPGTVSCHMTCDGSNIDYDGSIVVSCDCSGGILSVKTSISQSSIPCSLCP